MKYIIKQIFIIALFLPNISFGIDGNLLLKHCLKADYALNNPNLKIGNKPFGFGLQVGSCMGLIQGTRETIHVFNIAKKIMSLEYVFLKKAFLLTKP